MRFLALALVLIPLTSCRFCDYVLYDGLRVTVVNGGDTPLELHLNGAQLELKFEGVKKTDGGEEEVEWKESVLKPGLTATIWVPSYLFTNNYRSSAQVAITAIRRGDRGEYRGTATARFYASGYYSQAETLVATARGLENSGYIVSEWR